jgi:hypothetical protein
MLNVIEKDKYMYQRIFSTKTNRKLSREDFEFVFQIFLESEELKKIVPNPTRSGISISFLDSNLTDETYNFVYEGQIYILKISIGDGELIQKEYNILKEIEELNLAPKALCFDHLPDYNNIFVLVTSFEKSLNYKQIPYPDRVKFLDYIGITLKNLHHNSQTEESEHENLLNFYEDLSDFRSNLSEEIMQELDKDPLFCHINYISKQLLIKARQELKSFGESFFDKNILCHTNLQFGTILTCENLENGIIDREVKFINFFSSFHLNPVFDLAFASLHMSLRGVGEEILLNNYLSGGHDIDANYIGQYLAPCKSVAWKIIMSKILSLSLYEKLIHKYDRIEKHIQIYDTYFNIRNILESEHPEYIKYTDAFLKL